jgi:hypothetical protein
MDLSLVANERRKLTANYINGIAIAACVVGGLAPLISVLGTPGAHVEKRLLLAGVICILASNAIHFMGRSILGGLKP